MLLFFRAPSLPLRRLLRTGKEHVWHQVKAMCMKADKTNLWAVKDAQFRLEVCDH